MRTIDLKLIVMNFVYFCLYQFLLRLVNCLWPALLMSLKLGHSPPILEVVGLHHRRARPRFSRNYYRCTWRFPGLPFFIVVAPLPWFAHAIAWSSPRGPEIGIVLKYFSSFLEGTSHCRSRHHSVILKYQKYFCLAGTGGHQVVRLPYLLHCLCRHFCLIAPLLLSPAHLNHPWNDLHRYSTRTTFPSAWNLSCIMSSRILFLPW